MFFSCTPKFMLLIIIAKFHPKNHYMWMCFETTNLQHWWRNSHTQITKICNAIDKTEDHNPYISTSFCSAVTASATTTVHATCQPHHGRPPAGLQRPLFCPSPSSSNSTYNSPHHPYAKSAATPLALSVHSPPSKNATTPPLAPSPTTSGSEHWATSPPPTTMWKTLPSLLQTSFQNAKWTMIAPCWPTTCMTSSVQMTTRRWPPHVDVKQTAELNTLLLYKSNGKSWCCRKRDNIMLQEGLWEEERERQGMHCICGPVLATQGQGCRQVTGALLGDGGIFEDEEGDCGDSNGILGLALFLWQQGLQLWEAREENPEWSDWRSGCCHLLLPLLLPLWKTPLRTLRQWILWWQRCQQSSNWQGWQQGQWH